MVRTNTILEELIENLEAYRYGLSLGGQTNFDDIDYAIKEAKSLLRKEKAALKKHFTEGKAENFNKPEDYLPKSAEEHFNEKYGRES